MSPWWSKPTADDAPDDYDPAEDGAQGDGPDKAVASLSLEDLDVQETSGRRRRRRRRDSEDQNETKGAASEDDERDSSSSGRRRRRRRKDADDSDASARSSDSRDTADDAEDESSGRRRRRRRSPDRKSDRSAKSTNGSQAKRKPKERDHEPSKPSSKPAQDLTFDGSAAEVDEVREVVLSLAEGNQSVSDERKIAMFCDLENVALGVRDSKEVNKFDIILVMERLLEKGKIIVKKAYCDWERYNDYKRGFHEAGIEMIDIPQKYYSGKNSADIKMVVDAMDLSFSKEHLDTFVLLSGDSDFSPLVSKLKENNKYVIGVGVKNSSSNLLVNNCDEFIYYEDIWRDTQKTPQLDSTDPKTAKAFQLMVDAIQALLRENKDVLWGSMIKQTMQRKKPSFNEGYYGYGSFSEMLEDAEKKKIVKLKKDQRSGSYIVTGFAR